MKQMSYVASVLLMCPHYPPPDITRNVFLKTALPSFKGKDSLEETFNKYFGKK